MARYDWFIDHADDRHSAFTKPGDPIYVSGRSSYVAFSVRPEEAEEVSYCTLTPEDAIKFGKALIKAGKEARRG